MISNIKDADAPKILDIIEGALKKCGCPLSGHQRPALAGSLSLFIVTKDGEIRRLQAKIDSLMFEYCPDEMTKEQKEEWGRNQMPAEPQPEIKL